MEAETWVSAHLTGGIGNRLFQFAAALGAAEKWNMPFSFVKTLLTKNDHGPMDTIVKLYPLFTLIDSSQRNTRMIEPTGDCFRFLGFPEEKPGDRIVIEGYRQTAKYFPKNLDLLQPSWDTFMSKEEQNKLQIKYGVNSVVERFSTWFLHIRLGDYKILPHHQIPIVPYYEKCLNEVPKESTIILFSDEPDLCSAWFEGHCKSRSLKYKIVNENEIESLFLMSQCWGGAIVANSTFSWWGAFFAKRSLPAEFSYRAYYPSIWGQGLPPAVDVVPEWGTCIQINL